MYAVIQAGGAGTRLKTISKGLPKPMVPIAGKPILEWQLKSFVSSGVKDFIFIISKEGNAIGDYFGDGSRFGVKIHYVVEDTPLGTAGGLFFVKSFLPDEPFFLCFGDLVLDVDWRRFLQFHLAHGGLVSAYCHPNSHPYDSDVLVLGVDDAICEILPKGCERNFWYQNITNAGAYVCSFKLLDKVTGPVNIDFEKNILPEAILEKKAFGYFCSEYVKDCGTPERFYATKSDLKKGIVAQRSLRNKQKAVFIDRDGTLNVYKGFIRDDASLELISDAAMFLKRINDSVFLPICITNQPVVARGETSFSNLERINAKLETLLGKEGAFLQDIFVCPHHPDRGYLGEVEELKFDCECRKPKIGLLLKAAEKYNIDLSQCWFIGDTKLDVQTGMNAGMKTILVLSGDPEPNRRFSEAKPTFTCRTLTEAANLIFNERNKND